MGPTPSGSTATAEHAAAVFGRVREVRPLVHQITNYVTANDAAAVTLAVGALPVMGDSLEEAAELAGQAAALVLNTGTPSPERVRAMVAAGRVANERDVPVVLDPVGVGLTGFRTRLITRIRDKVAISVVRGNRGEMAFLAGGAGQLTGVDATPEAWISTSAARSLAGSAAMVVAVTGPEDLVTDGTRAVVIENGHPAMTQVTGAGCMATALVACCVAVEADYLIAAMAGLAALGMAGERAAERTGGPGSLRTELLDELARLSPTDLRDGCRIRPLEVADWEVVVD